MICPKCHSINADGMRFCGNCGTALSVAWPTQQMPQPQYGQQSPSTGAGAGGQGRGGKGLVIALVAGVATLVVVVAVLAVMLLRRSTSGPDVPYDGGSYGTRNADTGKTGPEQTDTSDSGKTKPEQTDTSDSGQSATNDTSTQSAEEIYAPVIEEYRNAIFAYDDDKTYQYLSMGMIEVLHYYDREEILDWTGYMIKDLSGDGIPELLIGTDLEAGAGPGTVFQLFTVKDGKLTEVFQGWGRNRYSWMGGNRFYHSGSGGAAYSAFGTFRLNEDGTMTNWDSFYFSSLTDDNEQVFYFNTTGEWDEKSSELLDMDFDEVWYFTEVWSQECVQPELTRFDGDDTAYTGGQITVLYADDFKNEYGREVHVYSYEWDETYGTAVVFLPDGVLRDVSFLKLDDFSYEDGISRFSVREEYSLDRMDERQALYVELVFPGDTPHFGIAYTDETGTRHYDALEVSGMDGSLFLSAFEPR